MMRRLGASVVCVGCVSGFCCMYLRDALIKYVAVERVREVCACFAVCVSVVFCVRHMCGSRECW